MYQPKVLTGQKRREVRIQVCKTNSKMFRNEKGKERKIRKKRGKEEGEKERNEK